MTSTHIKDGNFAETVLLPGDPKRSEYIAQNYLKNVEKFNGVRGMFGYTGLTPRGKQVTVHPSGMGQPSLGIYVTEMANTYKVKKIIRIGTAGSLQESIPLRKIVLAQAACTDSGMNKERFPFGNITFAPVPSWKLFCKAIQVAEDYRMDFDVGNTFATDAFYAFLYQRGNIPESWKMLADYNVKAVEMESSELFTAGAQYGVETMTILTISDHLVSKVEPLTSEERETLVDPMMKIALELI
jgi:purine-nucleoside phosphorylase